MRPPAHLSPQPKAAPPQLVSGPARSRCLFGAGNLEIRIRSLARAGHIPTSKTSPAESSSSSSSLTLLFTLVSRSSPTPASSPSFSSSSSCLPRSVLLCSARSLLLSLLLFFRAFSVHCPRPPFLVSTARAPPTSPSRITRPRRTLARLVRPPIPVLRASHSCRTLERPLQHLEAAPNLHARCVWRP
jgi:hypothetical protein